MLRQESSIERAFQAKGKEQSGINARKQGWNKNNKNGEGGKDKKEKYPSCQHCKKASHPHWRCCFRPEVV